MKVVTHGSVLNELTIGTQFFQTFLFEFFFLSTYFLIRATVLIKKKRPQRYR